jgi:hypothetical protein
MSPTHFKNIKEIEMKYCFNPIRNIEIERYCFNPFNNMKEIEMELYMYIAKS